MLKEFKEFALRGNIMDMAIGVIIGGAFQSIVNSLVNDIIMPIINSMTGKMDFSEMTFNIGNSVVKYGSFISAVVNFLIVAFTLLAVLRYINRLNKKLEEAKKNEKLAKLNKLADVRKGIFKKLSKEEETAEESEEEPETKLCPYCLSEIPYKATRCGHCTSKLDD
jgi:large conductance mechanosensitive channel